MDESKIFIDPTAWTDHLYAISPYRYASGSAGIYYNLIPGMVADTVQQMLTDALCLRFTKLGPNFSPYDAANLSAKEFGIMPYEAETDSSFREKVLGKWDFVSTYGQQNKLFTMLSDALSGSYSVGIVTQLDGTDIEIPIPKNRGIPIQPYPPTSENRTQFNVAFYLNSGSIGSGSYSNLVSDYQISLVRDIIRTVKPVQWACREMIFISNPNAVQTWNDGTSTWDDGTSTWDESDSEFVMERHSYQTTL